MHVCVSAYMYVVMRVSMYLCMYLVMNVGRYISRFVSVHLVLLVSHMMGNYLLQFGEDSTKFLQNFSCS